MGWNSLYRINLTVCIVGYNLLKVDAALVEHGHRVPSPLGFISCHCARTASQKQNYDGKYVTLGSQDCGFRRGTDCIWSTLFVRFELSTLWEPGQGGCLIARSNSGCFPLLLTGTNSDKECGRSGWREAGKAFAAAPFMGTAAHANGRLHHRRRHCAVGART